MANPEPTLTHAELVARAARWLRNSVRCGVVLTEALGTGDEIPDAIGWKSGCIPESYLVECKVSRADFRIDARKPFRLAPGLGMGRFRYFLTPPGLISAAELPPRWGLLEARGSRIRTVRKAGRWQLDTQGLLLGFTRELSILLSELRKVQLVEHGEVLIPSRVGRRIMALMGDRLTREARP